jgi:hypothetical protein
MRELNYTTTKMFRDSDEFFQSIGLIPMNEEFWKNSIFDRPPPPREIVCHPEAYDLCNKQHFFIKQCATVTMRDYITAHHEMVFNLTIMSMGNREGEMNRNELVYFGFKGTYSVLHAI